MPKRIVDGEGIWTSEKLRAVQPYRFRAEYANLLPLALANGVFECDPYLIWTRVYCFNRPDVSYDDTRTILGEFERVGLLFRWGESPAKVQRKSSESMVDSRSGKIWGFWVGIDKDGRLPPPTQRLRMQRGPEPPKEQLEEYLDKTRDPRTVLGQSYLGLVGFGRVGLGNTKTSAAETAAALLDAKGPEPPDWIPIETWGQFRKMRLKIRRPLTEHAVTLLINKLQELRTNGEDVKAILEQSIIHSWAGIYSLKGESGNGTGRDSQVNTVGRHRGSTGAVPAESGKDYGPVRKF